MKKIVVILLMLICVGLVKGQDIIPFKIGIKAGTNYSKLKVISDINSLDSLKNVASNFKLGAHIGPWARISIKKVYIQPEALFSIKSATYDIEKLDPNGTVTQNLSGLKLNIYDFDLNLLFGYYILNLPIIKLRANIGPTYTITLGGKQVGFEDVSTTLKNVDIKELYKDKQNIGYHIGAGVDIGSLTIDLYYQGTFQKLRLDLGSTGTLEQRLNLFKFSVGWSFL